MLSPRAVISLVWRLEIQLNDLALSAGGRVRVVQLGLPATSLSCLQSEFLTDSHSHLATQDSRLTYLNSFLSTASLLHSDCSLVEECRGSTLIGREVHSDAAPALLYHKDRWLPCTERSYYRRPYAIKNQRRASKDPSRGLWMPELVLYGIRELAQQHYEALDQ